MGSHLPADSESSDYWSLSHPPRSVSLARKLDRYTKLSERDCSHPSFGLQCPIKPGSSQIRLQRGLSRQGTMTTEENNKNCYVETRLFISPPHNNSVRRIRV